MSDLQLTDPDPTEEAALRVLLHRNVTSDDEYYRMIRSGWSDSLRHAFHALPNPDLAQ